MQLSAAMHIELGGELSGCCCLLLHFLTVLQPALVQSLCHQSLASHIGLSDTVIRWGTSRTSHLNSKLAEQARSGEPD